MRNSADNIIFDPIKIEIYKHLFSSIADEMGTVLRKASFSPNIKERRDFSCALFNAEGDMIAQASHIPVHLGSMPLSVKTTIAKFNNSEKSLLPGDTFILNDPYHGGTHLPDITLVTPVFIDSDQINTDNKTTSLGKQIPIAFVANRAHHSDVGGIAPGSMPLAREIYQEGLIIPPIKIINAGVYNHDILDLILANVRTPDERTGDLHAQIGSNLRGVKLIHELIDRYALDEVERYMHLLLSYSERMTRQLIQKLPDGIYCFEDYLDNNGMGIEKVRIKACIEILGDHVIVDFSGSDPQQEGSINAVYAITLAAVNYVFRSLTGLDVPNNSGCMAPISILAPEGSIVNASKPAPVAGGNVETSQRIVDVLLGALSQANPKQIPAASQGTMNNISIGGWNPDKGKYYTYYETIGGGTGASADTDGTSAIHSHMTNTLNTPIEAMEYAYPLRVNRYEIRRGSGGTGFHRGGDGIIREIEFLNHAEVTLLTERRSTAPYGLFGGSSGMIGINELINKDGSKQLPGKGSFSTERGDILRICTPGGGGFGEEP